MTHATPPDGGAYLVRKLRDLDTAMMEAVPRVVTSADDDAIRDMRVAIRRLRTMLKMSREIFGRWHSDVAQRAFADVMRATGDLRDEEVLEETLEARCRRPDLRGVGKITRGARKEAACRRREADPARQPRQGAPDAEGAARASRRSGPRYRASGSSRVAPQSGHVGRWRNSATSRSKTSSACTSCGSPTRSSAIPSELLTEALPLDARAMLEPATVFQKRLGELHDVDVAVETIAQARTLKADLKQSVLASPSEDARKRVRGSTGRSSTRSSRAPPRPKKRCPAALQRWIRTSCRPSSMSLRKCQGAQRRRRHGTAGAKVELEDSPRGRQA